MHTTVTIDHDTVLCMQSSDMKGPMKSVKIIMTYGTCTFLSALVPDRELMPHLLRFSTS